MADNDRVPMRRKRPVPEETVSAIDAALEEAGAPQPPTAKRLADDILQSGAFYFATHLNIVHGVDLDDLPDPNGDGDTVSTRLRARHDELHERGADHEHEDVDAEIAATQEGPARELVDMIADNTISRLERIMGGKGDLVPNHEHQRTIDMLHQGFHDENLIFMQSTVGGREVLSIGAVLEVNVDGKTIRGVRPLAMVLEEGMAEDGFFTTLLGEAKEVRVDDIKAVKFE
jgi:hypothetical protein